jgi:hypothetical protein
MSAKLCSKSGCGAIARIGYPCTDWNCPQDVVSANEYRRALTSSQEEIERLRKALEEISRKGRTTGFGKSALASIAARALASQPQPEHGGD